MSLELVQLETHHYLRSELKGEVLLYQTVKCQSTKRITSASVENQTNPPFLLTF